MLFPSLPFHRYHTRPKRQAYNVKWFSGFDEWHRKKSAQCYTRYLLLWVCICKTCYKEVGWSSKIAFNKTSNIHTITESFRKLMLCIQLKERGKLQTCLNGRCCQSWPSNFLSSHHTQLFKLQNNERKHGMVFKNTNKDVSLFIFPVRFFHMVQKINLLLLL